MAEALKDVYLSENNLEKMRKASKGSAQTLKMKDGNLKMDSFTASAIMQIYDKINDKNKKTFEKMMKDGKRADIMKLQKFAMSKISSEYVPEEFEEEFELDEKVISLAKGMGKEVVNDNGAIKLMKGGKVISTGDYDRGAGVFFMNVKGKKGQQSFDEPEDILKIKEELELDEAKYVLYL